MKSPRVLIALSVLLLTVVALIWDRLHTFYPTPETESAFFKNYSPTNVLDRFKDEANSSSLGGRTAAAGHDSVTHAATFDGYFALRSEKWMPLMDALRDDVAAQLVGTGRLFSAMAAMLEQDFTLTTSLAKLWVPLLFSPLALTSPSLIHRRMPLPNGLVDAHTSIEVAEKWFPKEPGVIQVSVNNSIQ